jgi:isopentenyl diphosphate isomerase/L-lactate dehydrogenase-like FMN-dependent dehydrogenase
MEAIFGPAILASIDWNHSNHGGRNLDTSPPSLLILLELQRHCPEIFDQLEVYVDGGIRRGTDILKAVCLGATAVSIGRTFLYALSYGEEGVEHLIDGRSLPDFNMRLFQGVILTIH